MYARFYKTFNDLPMLGKVTFVITSLCFGVAIGVLPMIVLTQSHDTSSTVLPEQTHAVSIPTTPIVETPPLLSVEERQQYRAAIVRVWVIDQSCYDEQQQIWFIHFPDTNDEETADGWFYAKHGDIDVTKLGNNTLMITNSARIFYEQVWPDITGLVCENHISQTQ